MRYALAGLFLLTISGVAFGQAEGTVESVGFGGSGYYRPNCWTPMKLSIRPTSTDIDFYKKPFQIEVIQEDLDKDREIFREFVQLTPMAGDSRVPQKVWTYFIPQPSGLGDRSDLPQKLRVYISTAEGRRISQMDVSALAITQVDPGNDHRGSRLVLVVREGGSQARLNVYEPVSELRGVVEEPQFHTLGVDDLPDKAIGYEAVDAMLWLNADPTAMSADALKALTTWVRQGGRLVVCQNRDKWKQFTSGQFGEMLPIAFPVDYAGIKTFPGSLERTMKTVDAKTGEEKWSTINDFYDDVGLRALRQLGGTNRAIVGAKENAPFVSRRRIDYFADGQILPPERTPNGGAPIGDPWKSLRYDDYPLAQAQLKPRANVDLFADEKETIPYLVRWAYGTGSVTWVAQDLGDPIFFDKFDQYASYGWTGIWDKIFDWRNKSFSGQSTRLLQSPMTSKPEWERYPVSNGPDVGGGMRKGMDLPSRGAALVTLAVLFFIGYWVVAGPGSFVLLHKRKLATFNWPAFAICAVAATALTALVVKLVLRGSAVAEHVTLVRMAPNEDTLILSNFGLFIPRDGAQTLELKETNATEGYVTAYPLHPQKVKNDDGGFLANLEYHADVPPIKPDEKSPHPTLTVPYRSTLKKFQAKVVVKSLPAVSGELRMVPDPKVVTKGRGTDPRGKLKNETGHDLHDVYFVWRKQEADGSYFHADVVLNMPDYDDRRTAAWKKDEVVDLSYLLFEDPKDDTSGAASNVGSKRAKQHDRRWGLVDFNSASIGIVKDWYDEIPAADELESLDKGALFLGLFSRLPPSRIDDNQNGRKELRRLEGRQWDASNIVSAGNLLILARSEPKSPLPFALEVEGEKVAGEGTIYYQIVVPIDRSKAHVLPPTATQPAETDDATTQPTSRPVKPKELLEKRPLPVGPEGPGGNQE